MINSIIPPIPSPLNYDALQSLLIKRDKEAHKGDFGHVLVLGGDYGFGGAALMAAEAAARCGSGLTSVATHPSHVPAFLSHRPELMCRGIDHPEQLDPLLAKASVIVLGPGLGQSDWSTQIFTHVMQAQENRELPMVIDADALNLLSLGLCADISPHLSKWILTPHVGEAARLLGVNIERVEEDRDRAAIQLQEKYQGVAILKGSGSLICYENENGTGLDFCEHGNPGMASGGMGDVLSGIIGGLLAQKFPLDNAARLGVCIHALSADKAAVLDGERGMLASDLFPWIRRLVNPR